jgi:hypothetical protein
VVGDRLQQLVDETAEALQRSVVLDDPQVRPLCTSRHFDDADEVRVRAVPEHHPDYDRVG